MALPGFYYAVTFFSNLNITVFHLLKILLGQQAIALALWCYSTPLLFLCQFYYKQKPYYFVVKKYRTSFWQIMYKNLPVLSIFKKVEELFSET